MQVIVNVWRSLPALVVMTAGTAVVTLGFTLGFRPQFLLPQLNA